MFVLLFTVCYYFYSASVGVRSINCDQPVCASVCVCVCLSVCLSVREHISGTAGPMGTQFCVRVPCGRRLVLLRRRCATLCTSGCMDDVTFGRNGRDEAIQGRSLMSMNACYDLKQYYS